MIEREFRLDERSKGGKSGGRKIKTDPEEEVRDL